MVTTLDFLQVPVQTYPGNVKCVLVLVGVGMMWAENALDQVFKVHECRAVSSNHKFSQLRGLLYVMTLVGICGDHIILPAQSLC